MAARKPQSPKDNTVRFVVNGDPLEIDPDELELGEIEDIEAHYDSDYADLRGTQQTIALVYIALKRSKPATSWDDVRGIKISALDFTEPKRPTEAAVAAGTQA